MRSKLWARESLRERSVLPPMGQMLNDQTGSSAPVESQEEMGARYLPELLETKAMKLDLRALADGFVGGAIFAWLYNRIAGRGAARP